MRGLVPLPIIAVLLGGASVAQAQVGDHSQFHSDETMVPDISSSVGRVTGQQSALTPQGNSKRRLRQKKIQPVLVFVQGQGWVSSSQLKAVRGGRSQIGGRLASGSIPREALGRYATGNAFSLESNQATNTRYGNGSIGTSARSETGSALEQEPGSGTQAGSTGSIGNMFRSPGESIGGSLNFSFSTDFSFSPSIYMVGTGGARRLAPKSMSGSKKQNCPAGQSRTGSNRSAFSRGGRASKAGCKPTLP